MSFLFVKIYYGPCHTFDTYIHKPHLLAGLRGIVLPTSSLVIPTKRIFPHQVVSKQYESFKNYLRLRFATLDLTAVNCSSVIVYAHGYVEPFFREIRDPDSYRLQKVGFRVCLVPVNFANYCMIEMCGHEVFRCNLKHLKFNTSYERDTVAQRAIEAVLTSAVKFRRGRACLWFWTLLNHQMFRRNKYEPKDYWLKEIDLTSFPSCTECMECCNILIKEEPKPEVAKPETYFKL